MAQRGQRAGLPAQPRQEMLVASELLGQNLDRHVPAERRVVRPVDLSHPALAQELQDLVGTKSPARFHVSAEKRFT